MTETTFRRRGVKRRTSRSVRIAERVARTLISIGGIGTIVAVTLILVFLVWVVVPMFGGASVRDRQAVAAAKLDASPIACGLDERKVVAWTLAASGNLRATAVVDGSLLGEQLLSAGAKPTAIAVDGETRQVSLGFEDGSIRLGRIRIQSDTLTEETAAPEARALARGAQRAVGGAWIERDDAGVLHATRVEAELDEPLATDSKAPVRAIDQIDAPQGRTVATLDASNVLHVHRLRETENIITGALTRSLVSGALDCSSFVTAHPAPRLFVAGGGNMAYLAAGDGELLRLDTRDLEHLAIAEQVRLFEPAADGRRARLSAIEFLLGRQTLLVGDSLGRLDAWFPVKIDGAKTCDAASLVHAHRLIDDDAARNVAVVTLATSHRSRVVAAGFADGRIDVFDVTSRKHLAALDAAVPALRGLAFAPREDGLAAFGDDSLTTWAVSIGSPEAALGSLFLPVWYEGYAKPEHVWQSTSGSDDFEPKLGLLPLVFGTLKATVYSMLFGVPLALLAALFSSEFLSPRVRVPIKSTVEIMAGLPSVVLGFLAAIVIAPFLQGHLAQVLTSFATIPLALLFGARLWQLAPQRWTLRFSEGARFLVIAAFVPLGVLAGAACGPLVERALFDGDLVQWLSGGRGSAVGGFAILLLPVATLAVAFVNGRWVTPRLRAISFHWSRARCAGFDLARFVASALATILVAIALAAMFAGLGLDARGGLLDTYVQRNALVVGFVMGFAIIPIIYTIAEDALSSVPAHLRLASLAAGATPWQTAVRVIVPTAASGLFSAVMVGLGRAVGETMIVLMATGNTAVMSWNAFSGFRTLSANLATELPEAVRNSTHYRTLFLAALLLFAMTFALNTLAEFVRQRFRKRAFQL